MTEPSTSAVDLAVTARIQAARQRTEDMRRQRAELAAARKAGLARRHAAKLAYLAEGVQRQADEQDGQDHDGNSGGSAQPVSVTASRRTP